MTEQSCVCALCQSEDAFWYCDTIIGGLHRVDKNTGAIRCVISPKDMYREGYFYVRKLLYWQDKIIIPPTELNKPWIIYQVNTEIFSVIDPISFPCVCEEIRIVGDHALCVPFYSDDPIAVLDLSTMQCVDRLYISHEREKVNGGYEIWNASLTGNEIGFLLRNSRYWCRIHDGKVRMVALEIPEAAGCADFFGHTGWALDTTGNNLYKWDKNGRFLEKIPLETRQESVRLVATQKYIFMLPEKGSAICVYDPTMHRCEYINSGAAEVEHFLPEPLHVGSYWDYAIEGKKIQFMPCKYPPLIVDLETLEYRQGNMSYPESFSENKYGNYYWKIQKLHQRISFKEQKSGCLKGFLHRIVYSEREKMPADVEKSKIWQRVQGESRNGVYESVGGII